MLDIKHIRENFEEVATALKPLTRNSRLRDLGEERR